MPQGLLGFSVWTSAISSTELTKYNSILVGILLLTNEVNLFIRYGFYKLKLEPTKVEEQEEQSEQTVPTKVTDEDEYNTGQVVGVLERNMMYTILRSRYNQLQRDRIYHCR